MFEGYLDEKFIVLETYRKTGEAVKTPVWFVIDNDILFIRTYSDSGKAKRLRRNPRARLALSTFRGEPRGDWVEVEIRPASSQESQRIENMMQKKYGIQKRFTDFRAKILGKRYQAYACTKQEEPDRKN
jgi:uncharacterized protein